MKKKGIVVKAVEKLGLVFGDGARCQLGFYEPNKPKILKEHIKIK